MDEEISAYVAYFRYYQRLIAVKIVSGGNTITDAAKIWKIISNSPWIKICESEGLEGLKSSLVVEDPQN